MSYTQSDIDKLRRAIATGALRVRFVDREVTYRSLEEMRKTLSMMLSEASDRPRTRQTRFITSKGLCR